jgi:hypothetical protein
VHKPLILPFVMAFLPAEARSAQEGSISLLKFLNQIQHEFQKNAGGNGLLPARYIT